MKKRYGVLPFVALFIGCGHVVPSPPDERGCRLPAIEPPIDPRIPEGWIKHDARSCKFSFAEDVRITKGFYRGRTGAVMELRDDGYVVDIYGYYGNKPSGRTVHRDAVVYGVPEEHLEIHDPDNQVR